jgi:SAM-dependent methyltransferase
MVHPRAGEMYRPPDYWGALHRTADLRAVGYPTLPLVFNQYSYANTALAVLRSLHVAGVTIRGRRVLDVGSGTGFWIDLWQREGAEAVAGADLVPEAVDRLRARFPDVQVTAANIAEQAPFPGQTFDVVTIMSVLHHVVDDEAFRRALVHLASQLGPGGRLVVLDPLVLRGRWMPKRAESAHNVTRTRAEWEAALAEAKLRILQVSPTGLFLSDPVDAGSQLAFRLHHLLWRGFTGMLQNRDRLADVVVPPIAALDRVLVPRLRVGPSTKMLVLRRSD